MSAEEINISFEEALARLEFVVQELEDGRLTLERALELYAEGIGLSSICSRSLEAAEQRISVLTANEKGDMVLKELDSLPGAGGK